MATTMRSCFNCGQHYVQAIGDSNEFCSPECLDADDARLAEGNAILSKAETQLTELNTLRLNTSGAIAGNLGNMIHFGRRDSTTFNSNLNNQENKNIDSDTIASTDDTEVKVFISIDSEHIDNEHKHSIEEINSHD